MTIEQRKAAALIALNGLTGRPGILAYAELGKWVEDFISEIRELLTTSRHPDWNKFEVEIENMEKPSPQAPDSEVEGAVIMAIDALENEDNMGVTKINVNHLKTLIKAAQQPRQERLQTRCPHCEGFLTTKSEYPKEK